ncbi:hypothetical protein CAI21_19745 [Alkalilimnicola ehrlichii]|uniref:Lipoprotein n=1 Tax=Alkalilimnicola ehrlichii TaxID=351052 RepID=A0A3E0WHA8_9GAMM|nr:hypothetical protein [Alkalilimnicola ehrlichii]RFA25206.1 hypothetical protein CAI21_19745 [Alkalilimnicola ehrlichii]RFA32284.1 hypothetical protein CAL65_20165 [Alkalilimnicola ehrlichii]
MFKRLSLLLASVFIVSACDNGVWIWAGDNVRIEAPGDEAVGESLTALIAHLAPYASPVAREYEDGVWRIRTKNELYDFTWKELEAHLQSFSAAEPSTASLSDLSYRFDPPDNLSKNILGMLDGNPFPFFIAPGVVPRMQRDDYVLPGGGGIGGRNQTLNICYLDILIGGDGIPPARYVRRVEVERADSELAQQLLDTVNASLARTPHGIPVPGEVRDADGNPVELLRNAQPHPDDAYRLYIPVADWTDILPRHFAGSASACFERDGGEDARRLIGQIGFPDLVGLDIRLVR